MGEEMTASQELLKEEMLAKLDIHHESMVARMGSQLEKIEACLEKTKVNPEETESEAGVETRGAMKERYDDRHLAVGRRRPKKRSQGEGGSRKNLTATRRWMTRSAGTARRMGRGNKGPAVEQRQQTRQEGSNRIRDRDLKSIYVLRGRGYLAGSSGRP
jgi:hypothetical protein